MQKKILINAITLERGNIVPLLLKIKKWQSLGFYVAIFCNEFLKDRIDKEALITDYEYIELKNTKQITNKFQFIFEAIRRNLLAIMQKKEIAKQFDVVYSISSVMDLVLFAYFLKRKSGRIKWITIFDNIVPLNDPGNKILRFLAWLFFRFSLFFLKKADKIFAISIELKEYLVKNGFDHDKIEVTGNAVEEKLIRNAKKNDKYIIDALFVGRINETKGIYDMLKVLEIIKKEFPNFQLAFMGEGDEMTEKKFRKKINEMQLNKNVQFFGYISGQEKFNIMKSAGSFWFLSTSQSESFGIALLEAVCLGVNAFAYDLKPYRAIYRNNEVEIFPKGDYALVAMGVIRLFKSNKSDNIKGTALLNKYNWESIAEKEACSF